MPRNMAMHDPLARIIRLESDSDIAVPWQQGHVSPGRIIVLERPIFHIIRMERPVLLREEDIIVPVEMHGVSDGDKDAFAACDLLGRTLGCHDKVDP